jgi:Bacteriophage Mu, Gp36
MAFVDDADVQVHLPIDKLKIEELPDDLAKCKEDAERIIRGYLAGVFEPATLASWIDPDSTPVVIRAIAGRLTAALIYRTRYSEDSLDDPEYAQNKYNEAMDMLMKVINGQIVLEEVDDDVATPFDGTWFTPNDASTDIPKFAMSDRY